MTQNAEITPRDAEKMRACALEPERLRGCGVREYGFGERVIAEGAPFGSLFVVTDGRAKVCVGAPSGKSLVLCFYVSSGLLGEAELFSGSHTGQTTVTALDSFRCVEIPVETNRRYLTENGEFAAWAAAALAGKLLQSTRRAAEWALCTAETRVCRYIASAAYNGVFRDVMTNAASSAGVSYRHLYRIVGELCRAGVLKKTDSGYIIADAQALQRRCLFEK